MPPSEDSEPKSSASGVAVICVLGPPGAGKGTLCTYLTQNYPLAHHSVGDSLRDWMRKNGGTPLAAAIQDKLDNQGFLSSQELNPFITTALGAAGAETGVRGLLIDGYPRCLEQLESFDTWPFEYPKPPQPSSQSQESLEHGSMLPAPNVVLAIRVDKSNARERYVGRTRDARDSAEKFERRFAEYEAETLPVLEIYRERGLLIEVDANGTEEENVRELERRLKANLVWKQLGL